MAKLSPSVGFRVKNTLADDNTDFAVKLTFRSMDDFHPAAIAEQVEPLRKLIEVRNRLRELLTRIDRSEELEEILAGCLANESEMKALSAELRDTSAASGEGDGSAPAAEKGE